MWKYLIFLVVGSVFTLAAAQHCDLEYLQKNTVGVYHLGETSLPVVNSITGTKTLNSNLTVGTYGTTVRGQVGNATAFVKASTQRFRSAMTTLYEQNSSFTLSYWMNRTAVSTKLQRPVSYYSDNATGGGIYTGWLTSLQRTTDAGPNCLVFAVYGPGGASNSYRTAAAPTAGVYNHIIARWSGADAIACVRGRCAGTVTANTTDAILYAHRNTSFSVGARHTSTAWESSGSVETFDGMIDEIHVFNVSLNASCILFLNATGRASRWNTTHPFYNATAPPANSCSCPAAGAWSINMSHHCNITANCLTASSVNFVGNSGYCNVSAIINSTWDATLPYGTTLWLAPAGTIYMRKP